MEPVVLGGTWLDAYASCVWVGRVELAVGAGGGAAHCTLALRNGECTALESGRTDGVYSVRVDVQWMDGVTESVSQ